MELERVNNISARDLWTNIIHEYRLEDGLQLDKLAQPSDHDKCSHSVESFFF